MKRFAGKFFVARLCESCFPGRPASPTGLIASLINPSAPVWLFRGASLHDVPAIASTLIGVADQLAPDRVCFGLIGTLGAGKTALAREMLRHLGVDPSAVTSPTFTLWKTHEAAGCRVHHLDAYRIADEDQWAELGVDEVLDGSSARDAGDWMLIEWADRFAPLLPDQTIWVEISASDRSDDRRDWAVWCDDAMTSDKIGRHFDSRRSGSCPSLSPSIQP